MPSNHNTKEIHLNVPADKKEKVVGLMKLVHDELKSVQKQGGDKDHVEALKKAKDDLANAHAQFYHSKSPTKLAILLPEKGSAKAVDFIQRHELKGSSAAAASAAENPQSGGNSPKLFSSREQSNNVASQEKDEDKDLSPRNG